MFVLLLFFLANEEILGQYAKEGFEQDDRLETSKSSILGEDMLMPDWGRCHLFTQFRTGGL